MIVIGGASGIGFAVAKLAHGQGADVVVASSNAANVDAATQRLPGISGRSIDLRTEASVTAFFEGPRRLRSSGDYGRRLEWIDVRIRA